MNDEMMKVLCKALDDIVERQCGAVLLPERNTRETLAKVIIAYPVFQPVWSIHDHRN